jgi:hypothetical protein
MLTRAAEQVAEHAKRVVRLEIELATLELKQKLGTPRGRDGHGRRGRGARALFGLGFALATIAAGLATFLPTWAALLIVAAFSS